MDQQPVSLGHVVVAPRLHAAFLDDLDKELSVTSNTRATRGPRRN